jgi:hypothetical protein
MKHLTGKPIRWTVVYWGVFGGYVTAQTWVEARDMSYALLHPIFGADLESKYLIVY